MVESKGGSQWKLWGIYKLVDIIEWSNLTIFKGHEMYSSLFEGGYGWGRVVLFKDLH